MQMPLQKNQVFLFNGQQIEILEKLNESRKIKLFSGIIKTLEHNILIIEINLNFQQQDQFQLLVYDQAHYDYYKEKFQFTFLKTQNDCLFSLHQHQIYFWHDYFQQQEFKLLPLQQKHRLFNKYCRKKIKQKIYDLCLFSQDHLGNSQLEGIDIRLFRDNDLINQLDLQFSQEQLQIDIQSVNNFGNLYFQLLTDIDFQQLNHMTLDQRIQLITDSPLYEWQKQEIINFLNPQFVQKLTKQNLLNILKEDHFDINTYSNHQSNQQIQITYQFSLQQQQIQSQLNYLYYQINKVVNNKVIIQEYQNLNKLNSEFQEFIKNYQSGMEIIIQQQLDQLIRLSDQFNFNLKQTLYENLILKHKKLQFKLDTFYQPTQFLGQFGTLQIFLYSKLQHQNKMMIQNLKQQSNIKQSNDILSILQFNQSFNKLNQISENIKIEFKAYQTRLVTELMQIKQLFESNSKRIQQEFESINIKYLMMVAAQEESDQTQFITKILEGQQILKKTIQTNQIPDIIYKCNSNKVDILSTTQQFQESEWIIRDLNQFLEEKYQEVFQLEEKSKKRILSYVNGLRKKNLEQLDEVKMEFNSQFQSLKLLLIEFSKNQNLFNNQLVVQSEYKIQLIFQKQIQRFQIIEELLEQNQTKKQYFQQISKKIEDERKIISIVINQELNILHEQFNRNYDQKYVDTQEQELLNFELIILQSQYYTMKCQLEQELQNIKQKFTILEAAFQEQLLLSRKIEILSQENKEIINHYRQKDNKTLDFMIRRINDKFEENINRFYQFFTFLKEIKSRIDLKQDQERLCSEIEQKLIEIQEQFQIIQNQNIKKSREEKRIEYQQLRSNLELISKEVIIKGTQKGFNSQGYYQQLTLIIYSKFYHMSRFYQRLMSSNALNNNQQIQIEDLDLINSQKQEYAQLESQVEYYKKLVIENGGQAFQVENLEEKLEELENLIEQKKNYLLLHLNKSFSQTKTIDQIQKFTNYLEFSKFLPFQLLKQNCFER